MASDNHSQFILPEQCRKCGAVFDLWYDLSNNSILNEETEEKLGKKLSESLCWNCKENIIKNTYIQDDKGNSSSFDELFLDFDFE
ncbi:MAG: hypothetical protein Q7S27_05130 [Nanoarchaeota archaeon]|nr:hypothetical protein [Nanoarchaeota archaeon]